MARDIGSLTTSQQFNDWVGAADSDDFYKFTLSNNSPTWNYSLRLSGLTADADVQLLSSSGSVIWHGANTGTSNELDSRALAAGTYYVRVLPGTSASETGYMLTLSATANAPPDGAGNTMSTAHEIGTLTTAQQFTDWVGASDDNDYYQFSLDAGANWNYTLFLSGLTADADVQLLNDSGESIWTGNASGITSESDSRPLAAGTYYVRAYPGSSSANTGYTLALSASRVNTAPNQKTIFETGIFDTGVGGQIKNFISGLLGRTLDSVRNYLSDRFEFFANSKWGIKLGFDVAADIGEGVSVDVASAEWGFSVEYDFAERTWRISRGFEASFLSASCLGMIT